MCAEGSRWLPVVWRGDATLTLLLVRRDCDWEAVTEQGSVMRRWGTLGIREDLQRYKESQHAAAAPGPDPLAAAISAFQSEITQAEEILSAAGVQPLPMFRHNTDSRHTWTGRLGYPMEGSLVLHNGKLYAGNLHSFIQPTGRSVHTNLPMLARRNAKLSKHDPYLLVWEEWPAGQFMLAMTDYEIPAATQSYRKGDLLLYRSVNDEVAVGAAGWLVRSVAKLTEG